MALNTYDAAKHHIALGGHGFTMTGAYAKDTQRETTGAVEYGGQTDLIGQVPGRSRWTQDDFTGGQYQYRLDKDVAMFSECIGFLPAEQSKSLITVPPLVLCKKFNANSQSNPASGITPAPDKRTPRAMFSVAGSVFTVFNHGIARYRHDTDTFYWLTPGLDAYSVYVDGAYDNNEHMYYAFQTYPNGYLGGGTNNAPLLQRFHEDGSQPTNQHTWNLGFSTSVSGDKGARGFQINAHEIVAGIGLKLYTIAPPVDTTDNTSEPTIVLIGRLPGYWVSSCAYNNMTYILTATVDGRTVLTAFDGTSISPICEFPYNFNGRCIQVYGGRVYVGGTGYALDGTEKYAELYEITGASVRKVRTFEPEFRAASQPAHAPRVIRDMQVAEGFLWLSIDGDRLIAYDIVTDGFFGASEFTSLANVRPYAMTICRGHLYVWNYDASAAADDGLYRVAASTDTFAAYTPKMATSDFIAEPAVTKSWSVLTMQTRYQAGTAEYSTDAGVTWTALSSPTTVTEGSLYTTTYDLQANSVPNSKHIRFRLALPRGSNTTAWAELIAYTVSFVFNSTGKHGWNITVNGAEKIEGRDGLNISQDVSAMATYFWGALNTVVAFKDVDGTTYNVNVQNVTEQMPIIGPNVTGGSRPEAYFGLVLVEV